MDKNEQRIADEAMAYVKRNKNLIIKQFADPEKFPPDNFPVSIFMAGSPGAGKTEFSKELVEAFFGDEVNREVVRIDADEIRDKIPGYNGANAYLFQPAASVAVEKIHDNVLDNKQNFILDGTLAFAFEKAKENIQRSIDKQRTVFIFYVYQDPITAWQFTQKRELEEGRRIPMEAFIRQFFRAKKNVNALKKLFGERVKVYTVEKNFENDIEHIEAAVEKVDDYINFEYTKNTLEKALKNL